MVKGIAHICISSVDLAATERFYCSGLGMPKVFDFIRKGEVIGFYLRAGGNAFVEVFQRGSVSPDAGAPISHLCLEVTDIDEVVKRLKTHGYETTAKVMGADWSWQAWVTDPAGVRIEFHQYTPDSCQLTGAPCHLE